MKKVKKVIKYLLVLTIIGGLGYSIYTLFFKKTSTTTTKIINYTVKKGSIENSIKVTGTAKLVDEQQIRFNQTGKITKVNFKQGDKVKKGQIIAELDSTDVKNTIKQSEISLTDSKINLQELLKGNEEKDKLQAKNSLESLKNKSITLQNDLKSLQNQKEVDIDKALSDIKLAKESLDNLTKEYTSKVADAKNQINDKKVSIESKQKDINLAIEELKNTKTESTDNISNSSVDNDKTLTNTYNDLRKAIADADKILNGLDMIFGISDDNKSKNDNFESYLSAKNISAKTETESLWIASNNLLKGLKNTFEELNSQDQNGLKKGLDQMYNLFENIANLSQKAGTAINNSISSSALSQSNIDSYYNETLGYISTANSSLSTAKTDLANIEKLTNLTLSEDKSNLSLSQKEKTIQDYKNTLNTLKNDLVSLESNLKLTIASYENKIKTSQADIDNKNNNLGLTTKNYEDKIDSKNIDIKTNIADIKVSEENLKLVLKGTTAEKIALAKNNIKKGELSIENAKKNLDKYRIEAPFDGIIGQIDFKVGDNLVSDESKYVYLKNPNLIEITSTVDQLDVVKMKIGQKVRIVFDSYANKEFEGNVSNINSSPTTTSGVTSYEIKITMDKKDTDIFSGMTTKLYIVVESKKDIIVIPSAFIEKKGNNSFVLGENNKTIEVVTGISTNTETEIVSGLNEGDKIIRKVIITNTSISTSLFGPGQRKTSSSGSSSSSSSTRSSGGGDFQGPPRD